MILLQPDQSCILATKNWEDINAEFDKMKLYNKRWIPTFTSRKIVVTDVTLFTFYASEIRFANTSAVTVACDSIGSIRVTATSYKRKDLRYKRVRIWYKHVITLARNCASSQKLKLYWTGHFLWKMNSCEILVFLDSGRPFYLVNRFWSMIWLC